jgi:plastocyanin
MGTATFLLTGALNGTAFYVLGSCLAALALVVTAIGLRASQGFPSRALTWVGILIFGVLVIGTATFAVLYSEDEQAHREAELAAEEAQEGASELPGGGEVPTPDLEQAEGSAGTEAAPEEAPAGGAAKAQGGGKKAGQQGGKQAKGGGKKAQPAAEGPGGTLALAADPAQIAYDKTALSSRAGPVTIDLDNPSQIAHDVAIAQGSREIAKSDLITDSSTSVTADLAPGKYVFFCTVPGHREAGMQGTLTVR